MTLPTSVPPRQDAWALLCELTASESLRRHALAVEAVMQAYARRYGEDEERWARAGLLHDVDYQRYPDEHPSKGVQLLKERGYPADIRHAILCHVPELGVPCESLMDKALLASDELAGFITAVTLVRPSKSLTDVSVDAVKKKLKDKAFARSVNRAEIYLGVDVLGVDLDDHIRFVLAALLPVADQLGLANAPQLATGA